MNRKAKAGILAVASGLLAVTMAGAITPSYAFAATTNAATASSTASSANVHSTVADRVQDFPNFPMGGPWVAAALDSQGNAYFSTLGSHQNIVYQVTPTGARQGYYLNSTLPIDGIRGVTVAPDGTVYVIVQLANPDHSTTEWLFTKAPGGNAFGQTTALYNDTYTNVPFHSTAYDPVNGAIAFTLGNSVKAYVPGTAGIITLAGNGNAGFSGDGGAATAATLNSPDGIAFDNQGNLYIADTANNRIRQVTPSGTITTIGGNGAQGYSGDGGVGTDASLNQPQGVATDSAGNVYIADTGNDRIRLLDNYRTITTVIGSGIDDPLTAGSPATQANLHSPQWVAVSGTGTIAFNSLPNSYSTTQEAYQAEPLSQLRLTTNPLPASISGAGTSGFWHRRGDAPGANANFNVNGMIMNPSADGTSYVSGPVTFVNQAPGGSPVTITAQSVSYTVTNPIEFSNLLLLNNVTFTHVVNGVTYSSTIPNLSVAYERGYGLSYVGTTPPNPMPWGDLVIPDLHDGNGALAPDNATVAGAWIMQIGLTVQPIYSPRS